MPVSVSVFQPFQHPRPRPHVLRKYAHHARSNNSSDVSTADTHCNAPWPPLQCGARPRTPARTWAAPHSAKFRPKFRITLCSHADAPARIHFVAAGQSILRRLRVAARTINRTRFSDAYANVVYAHSGASRTRQTRERVCVCVCACDDARCTLAYPSAKCNSTTLKMPLKFIFICRCATHL